MLDSLLHVLAAVLLSGIFTYASTPWTFMSVANGLFWFGREAAQKDYDFSRINHIEWVLPTVAGVITAYAVAKISN